MALPKKRYLDPHAHEVTPLHTSKAPPKKAVGQGSPTPRQRSVRGNKEVTHSVARSIPNSRISSRAPSRPGSPTPSQHHRSVYSETHVAHAVSVTLPGNALAGAHSFPYRFVCLAEGVKPDELDDAWEQVARNIPSYPGWTILKMSRGIYRIGGIDGMEIQCLKSNGFEANGRILVMAPTHQGVADAEVFLQWHSRNGSALARNGAMSPPQRRVSSGHPDGFLQSPRASGSSVCAAAVQVDQSEQHAREVATLQAKNSRLSEQLAASLASLHKPAPLIPVVLTAPASPRSSILHMPHQVSMSRIAVTPVVIHRVVRSTSVAPLPCPPEPALPPAPAPPPVSVEPPALTVVVKEKPPPAPVPTQAVVPREFGPDHWSPRRPSRHAALPLHKREHL